MSAKESWLPNLVGGVSIWKLASDLNQEHFFGGRLLVPETEGSDSLPVKVTWNVDGLLPLTEARTKHLDATVQAIAEFLGCLERARKELAAEGSGYRRFKDALTVPSLEGAGIDNYFFDPRKNKLHVINWGASPRALSGRGTVVFGYDRFDELVRRAGAVVGPGALGATEAKQPAELAGAVETSVGSAAGGKPPPGGADKPQEAKPTQGSPKRPWVWIALGVVVLFALVLLATLWRACEREPLGGSDAGVDAGAPDGDAGGLGDGGAADQALDSTDERSGDGGPTTASLAADAGGSDGAERADGKSSAPDDAHLGKDARVDGALAAAVDNSGTPPENGKVYVILGDLSGAGAGGGAGAGAGAGAGGGGASSGADSPPRPRPKRAIPFRAHFQPDAVAWRISDGADIVDGEYPPVMNHGAFEVYLKAGHNFDEIKVEYKDKSGQWHVH